jgi:RNA polymerase sigma-70 factor (ECF subfamily)
VRDAELVLLARAGEAAAFAELFERHRPWLHAVAISILRNRDDALDAVQDTCVTALVRLDSLRDPDAVRGWLQAIVRNACRGHLRRASREAPRTELERAAVVLGPEEVLAEQAMREWIWTAMEPLTPEDRLTTLLRHFSRCDSYQAIAEVTAVPVGTVRSRLHRARSQLATELGKVRDGAWSGHRELEAATRARWDHFYAEVHRAPTTTTYREVYDDGVAVRDTVASWRGRAAWSAHEREAIELGVRARIIGIQARRDLTVLEIDLSNPPSAGDHCPPPSTFVHRLHDGRSHRLDIMYV